MNNKNLNKCLLGIFLIASIVLLGAKPINVAYDFFLGILTDTIGEHTANTGVTVDGVLIKDGEVDGRDVSVDGAKLDGIATGADVVGPASSTDEALARFNLATGKLLQNSLVTSDDSGSVNIPTGQKYKINNVNLSATDVGAEPTITTLNEARGGTGLAITTETGYYHYNAGTGAVIKSNLNASATPAVTDDSNSGYAIGSVWIDTTANISYLCIDASVGTAVWDRISNVTGTGEANTISNQGTAGVTVVASPSKVGVDLQLNSINAGSNKIGVALDAGNKEVDIDVNPANIPLDTLGTPTDITTNNATTSYHGLLRKLDGNVANVLRGDGTWGSAGTTSPLTTKGDLYGFSTVNARFPVGTDGYTIEADSLEALGVKWVPKTGSTNDASWTGANWTATDESPSQRATEEALEEVGIRYADKVSGLGLADNGALVQAFYNSSNTWLFGQTNLDAIGWDYKIRFDDLNERVNTAILTNSGVSFTGTSVTSNNCGDFERSESDYAYYPSIPTTLSTTFSISLWIKFESWATNVTQHILGLENTAQSNYDLLFFEQAQNLKLNVAQSNGTFVVVTSTDTLALGTWYHIILKADATNISITINNGTPVTGAYNNTIRTTNQSRLVLGRYNTNLSCYDGLLSDLYITNEVFDATDISDLYNSGAGRSIVQGVAIKDYRKSDYYTDQMVNERASDLTAGDNGALVQAYYTANSWTANNETLAPFDTDLESYYSFANGAITTDSKGTNTLTNSGADNVSSGKYQYCAEFVKANTDYLEIATNPFIFTGECTIAFWAYFDTQTTNAEIIANDFTNGFSIVNNQASNLIVFYNSGDNGGSGWNWTFSPTDDTWYHIAFRRDSSNNLFCYINGSQVGSSNSTSTTIGSASYPFRLGAGTSDANYLDGKLDEIGLWDVDLGASGISALYADSFYSGAGATQDYRKSTNARLLAETSTTNATLTEIANVAVPEDRVVYIEANIIGRKSDGTDRATYKIAGCFYRNASGNVTQQGSTADIITPIESNASWATGLSADTGNQTIDINVTGVATTDIDWKTEYKWQFVE